MCKVEEYNYNRYTRHQYIVPHLVDVEEFSKLVGFIKLDLTELLLACMYRTHTRCFFTECTFSERWG